MLLYNNVSDLRHSKYTKKSFDDGLSEGNVCINDKWHVYLILTRHLVKYVITLTFIVLEVHSCRMVVLVFFTCVSRCEYSTTWRPSNDVDRVLVPREVAQALRLNLAVPVDHKLPYLNVRKIYFSKNPKTFQTRGSQFKSLKFRRGTVEQIEVN